MSYPCSRAKRFVRTQSLDQATVAGFGAEWSTFDQSLVPADELDRTFGAYFADFPYLPLAGTARVLERRRRAVEDSPLSFNRDHSF